METIKILFLLALSFSTLYISEAQWSSKRHDKSKNLVGNQWDKCFCPKYKNTNVLVPDILGDDDSTFDRLVIYLYRGRDGNIVMYTPSVETQRALPELPLQSSDDLKVIGTQTLPQIFNYNPFVITIEKLKSLHYDYIVKPGSYPVHKKGPIGVNIGNIQEKKLVTGKVTTDQFSVSHQNTGGENSDPKLNEQTFYNDPQFDSTLVTSNIKEVYQRPSTDSSIPLVTFNNDLEQLIKGQEINPSLYGNEKENVWHLPEQKNVQMNTVDVGYDNADQTRYNKYSYKTFNAWFFEQTKLFPELYRTSYNYIININVLKNEVVKIIEQNGMRIEVDGLVHDTTGSIVDMRNMKLRRIVIEERMANKLTESPFLSLDGVMITLIYPPKILGVIPLKRNYFSSELPKITKSLQGSQLYQSQQPLHQTFQTTHSVRSSIPIEQAVALNELSQKCKGSICGKQSYWYELPADGMTTIVSSESQNINDFNEIEKQLQLQGKSYDTEIPMRKDTKKTEEDSSLQHLTNVLDTYKLNPLNQLTNMMKTVVEPLTTMMNQTTDSKEGSQEETFKKSEEDNLGFRIIGGYPATASGVPLNLKGRSGDTDVN